MTPKSLLVVLGSSECKDHAGLFCVDVSGVDDVIVGKCTCDDLMREQGTNGGQDSPAIKSAIVIRKSVMRWLSTA